MKEIDSKDKSTLLGLLGLHTGAKLVREIKGEHLVAGA